jgi:CheY-like chemotaxis protein
MKVRPVSQEESSGVASGAPNASLGDGPDRAVGVQQNVNSRTRSVVVADDEPEVLDFYERVLTMLGWSVAARATNGRELIEKCRELRPDLIVTDVRMPEMSGPQAMEQIASESPTPVIFISAQVAPDFRAASFCDCVLQYLLKPVKRVDLEAAIRQAATVLGRFQAHQRAG